jgi:hypothetical protein
MTTTVNEDNLIVSEDLDVETTGILNVCNRSGAGVSAPAATTTSVFFNTDTNTLAYINTTLGTTINITPPEFVQLTSTTAFATTSTTYVTIPSTTTTLSVGEYLVLFSASVSAPSLDGGTFALFNGGTIIPHTERSAQFGFAFGGAAGQAAMSTQAFVEVLSGTVTIDVRTLALGGGTITVGDRNLIVLKTK